MEEISAATALESPVLLESATADATDGSTSHGHWGKGKRIEDRGREGGREGGEGGREGKLYVRTLHDGSRFLVDSVS